MSKFVHLHVHSEYSVLDGMSRVKEIVGKAKEFGQSSIAITDHGHLGSTPEFYKEAHNVGINPILGQEFYIVEDTSNKDIPNSHVIILAKDRIGYQLLCELSSIASEHFYRKPRLDHTILREHSKHLKHLIVTSACLSGEVQVAIRKGDNKQARRMLEFYNSLFPNYFIEIMSHAFPYDLCRDDREREFKREEDLVNNWLIKASEEYNIPLVITNDSHYTESIDQLAHEHLLAMQTGGKMSDEKRFRFGGTGFHIKSTFDMKRLFSKKLWVQSEHSMDWIQKNINIRLPELEKTVHYIPDAGLGEPNAAIKRRCIQGIKQHIPEKDHKQYVKQLLYELKVIKESDFANEFLIVADYVDEAKRHGIVVGSGRGSMAGVLVSYLMDITVVDPIRFKLSFERALNPARPSLPDFDIDFNKNDIQRVFQYLRDKYGEQHTMRIGTYLRMKPRSCLDGIMRVLGYDFQTAKFYTKQLPDTFAIVGAKSPEDLAEILAIASPDIIKLLDKDKRIAPLMFKFENLIRGIGSHAAGFMISDDSKKIRHFIPGTKVREDTELVSQYDMKGLKSWGFIKFDILSLKTLDIIKDVMHIIGKDVFENFPDNTLLDDKKTIALLNTENLTGIFQLDGYANRAAIKSIGGIDNFEDIVSVSSIARPGTSQFIPEFSKNKANPKKIKYIHKDLIPILQATNGILLFQEQVMQIAQRLAGFDMIQVDDMKEMIKGKEREKFDEMRPQFISGCVERGYTKKMAEEVWSIIEKSSSYLYNRAHAVSYSLITYQTAWLKAHYPREFLTVCLNMGDTKQRKEIIHEAMRMDIKIVRPSIQHSGIDCEIEGDHIRIGLSLIKGMGQKSAFNITTARDEFGLAKAIKTMPRFVWNIRVQKALKAAGAMGMKHTTSEEQEVSLGFSLIDPVKKYRKYIDNNTWEEGNDILLGGVVTKVRSTVTKNGDDMAFVAVSDKGVVRDLVVFPTMMGEYMVDLSLGNVVLVRGTKQSNYNSIVPQAIEIVGR